MLPLDVPFTPDPEYVRFLSAHRSRIGSVHFSLHHPGLADARQLMEQKDVASVVSGLGELVGVRKYVLMNARLHAPEKYFSRSALDETGALLSLLVDHAGIDGLIYSDPYYLQALSDAHPALAGKLEAVPSVNAMLDNASRVFATLEQIENTGFRMPTKLVLDRSLNRDIKQLEATAQSVRAVYPGIQLHLIANEGCLYQCPYKPAHDAHIALVNEGLCGERTFAMNRDFGCVRRLLTDRAAMLASPFIRPEDASRYESLIDGIKLCGRNRGTPFLKKVITAYLYGVYNGNLLDLMDAMGDLADRVDIPNQRIPDNFHDRVTACDKACRHCGWCGELACSIITGKDPGLG